jgi:hypothetical protein
MTVMGKLRHSIQGTLRINDGLEFPGTGYDLEAPQPGEEWVPEPPAYEKLIKLFPAEGVALYPLASGIAGGDGTLLIVLVGIIAAVVLALRALGTKPPQGGRPDWIAVFVSVASFLLYAASLGAFGYFQGDQQKHTLVVSFATIIWLAFVPHMATKPATRSKQPT